MTKRTFVAIEIEQHLKAGLEAVKQRDGIAIKFQVSKAIEAWLAQRGIAPAKAAKPLKGGKKK